MYSSPLSNNAHYRVVRTRMIEPHTWAMGSPLKKRTCPFLHFSSGAGAKGVIFYRTATPLRGRFWTPQRGSIIWTLTVLWTRLRNLYNFLINSHCLDSILIWALLDSPPLNNAILLPCYLTKPTYCITNITNCRNKWFPADCSHRYFAMIIMHEV